MNLTTIQNKLAGVSGTISSAKSGISGGISGIVSKGIPASLSFPSDIGNSSKYPDAFMIKIFENSKAKSTPSTNKTTTTTGTYSNIANASTRISEAGSGSLYGSTGLYKKAYSEYILLPMPNELNFSQSSDWGQENIGISANAAQKISEAGSRVEGVKDSIVDGVRRALQAMQRGVLTATTGVNGEAIQKINSRIQNEFSEILFNGQQQRQFSFTWKFLPENATDSQNIKNIIKLLRGQAAPDLKSTNFVWVQVPSLFECVLLHAGGENQNLPKISTCALTGIDVNYFASGASAFFHDGYPVGVDLSLSFQELEILDKARILEDGY